MNSVPNTFHFSLFAFHFSLFAFHFSLFTSHFSLFAFRFSLLTFRFSLLTIRFSLFASRPPPKTETLQTFPPSRLEFASPHQDGFRFRIKLRSSSSSVAADLKCVCNSAPSTRLNFPGISVNEKKHSLPCRHRHGGFHFLTCAFGHRPAPAGTTFQSANWSGQHCPIATEAPSATNGRF